MYFGFEDFVTVIIRNNSKLMMSGIKNTRNLEARTLRGTGHVF